MSFPRAVALAAICCSLPATAQAAERHEFNLPAGRLGDSLAVLGRQARISIGVSDPALAAQRVPAVRGRMTVQAALDRLLRGTHARATFIDSHTVRIIRTPRAPPPRRRTPRADPPAPPPPPLPRQDMKQPDIIVTASRRAVPLSSYPGSVAIVAGDDPFLAAELRGSDALVERLPSVTSTHLGPGRNKLFVRGISDSSFTGPTQATVAQYLGEMRMNYSAPDPDLRLYDVSRIEVLPGPQGTLYGAGSLGGIIRVVLNPPLLDHFGGRISVGASATAHGGVGGEAAATLNAPIVPQRLAARISAYAVSEPGYIDDTLREVEDVNRVRIVGGRASLRSRPDDHWTIDAEAIGQAIRGDDAQFAEAGQPPLTRRSSVTQNFESDYFLGGVAATREWDDYTLVGSGSFARQHLFERYDATRAGNPPAAYDLDTDASLISLEGRLSRRLANGTGWLVGAALLSNAIRQSRTVEVLDNRTLRNRVTNDVVEGALYGEASLRVSPRMTASVGGRISGARVSSSGFVLDPGTPLPKVPVHASRQEVRFLPVAALTYDAADDLLVYARYQQSFRPGGLAVAGSSFNRFRSDSIASIELGARYRGPGRGPFDASVALAYTRWNDVQADTLDLFAEPTTANIGDARLYTLDASIGWRPLPGLALEAGAVLNHSEVWNIPPGLIASADPPLPGVASVNGRVAVHYGFQGPLGSSMRLSAAARYTGRSNLGVGEFFQRSQGDWLDTSAVLRAESGRHALSLAVTNLLDTRANRFAFGSPFTLDQKEFQTPVRPRAVTLTWELRY